MKYFIQLLLILPVAAFAQKTLFLGAVAHLGNGQKIESSAISMENGTFDFVVDATSIRINPNDFDTIIHVYNHHAYPTFISTNTTLGISEISAVRASNDFNETGNFKPHVRSLIAFNAESKIIPTIRTNGVLLAQVSPQGGTISGTSSVMKLDGWNWEDAAQKQDDGIHLNWPSYFRQTGWWAEPGDIVKTDNYTKKTLELKQYLVKAQAYYKSNSSKVDIEMEAMTGIFDGTKHVYIHANLKREMMDAVLMAQEFDLKTIVIVGAKEAHLISDFLSQNNIMVLLDRIHRLPRTQDEDVYLPYKQAALLDQAGIKFGFCYQGDMEAMGQRNLPFSAGTAVAYGLDYEKAVSALSLNIAQMLGIDKEVGSLESGKEATFFISEGDALDMMGNKVVRAYIQGKSVDLDNHQKQLDRKYRKKYGLEVN
ncbi:MAG: amidohydrolase family protein [Flavobacteriales bacterium]|tara:strand:- start:1381 stop:2655 length:1275 start_codon:yes stop_codon:yes gene_type:complete